ncbi:RUS family member 1, partial [Chiloscyllium punctatum]|uniref:RUS family member 1 n=1 Tax=Chiloscyllium punctatum TaxID=137246 RepID=UPI003B639608
MESEETDIVCSERYGSHCSRPYTRSREGKLHRGQCEGLRESSPAISIFTSVFLPQGYPESVSEDYLGLSDLDTVQAFASSVTGTLATQAVLK